MKTKFILQADVATLLSSALIDIQEFDYYPSEEDILKSLQSWLENADLNYIVNYVTIQKRYFVGGRL